MHRGRLCILPIVLLQGCSNDVIDTGPACDAAAELPSDLGIANDDDDWLCDHRPESPRTLDGIVRAAGVTLCYAGDRGQVTGSDIYVAPDGDDDSGGATPEQALRTLTEAMCRVRPGQTVHLAPGHYEEAVLLGLGNRADSAPVTITGEGESPGDVVLDGGHWRSFALGLADSHNVTIANLSVQHYTDAGIYTLNGSGITLTDLLLMRNGRCSVDPDSEGEGFGVNLVGTTGIVVKNSVFDDNGPLLAPVLCGEVLGTGINTFESSGIIEGNTLRRTRGGAMLVEKSAGPFMVNENLAEQNYLLALDNYWDAALWIDESVDVEVRDNTFRANYGGAGVQISDEEGSYPSASRQIRMYGNTIVGNTVGILVWGYDQCPPPADVALNWQTLEADNQLTGNLYRGEDTPILCDPMFVGGTLP